MCSQVLYRIIKVFTKAKEDNSKTLNFIPWNFSISTFDPSMKTCLVETQDVRVAKDGSL